MLNQNLSIRKRKVVSISVTVTILLLICSGAYYFAFWKKSPEYSLLLIQDAVRSHDLNTFTKHVDLENLTSKAFDDLVASNVPSDSNNVFFEKLIKNFKPVFVNAVKGVILEYVEKGTEASKVVDKKDDSNQFNSKSIGDNYIKNGGFWESAFKGVKYTKIDGDTAVVGLEIFDNQLQQSFVLDVKMQKLDDGTWKVVELSNINTYMNDTKVASEKKLAELNKLIEQKLSKYIEIGKITFSRHFDSYSRRFVSYLLLDIQYNIKGDNDITEVTGKTIVKLGDKVVISEDFNEKSVLRAKTVGVFSRRVSINNFIRDQDAVNNADLKEISVSVQVSKIVFADGEQIALMTNLPENTEK